MKKYQLIQLSKYQQISTTNTCRWASCSSKRVRTMWKLCENALHGPQKLPAKRWNNQLKRWVNTYQQITIHIDIYQYISTNMFKFKQISMHINKYQQISMHINNYQYISATIFEYNQIWMHINKYQYISTNIFNYKQISTNINKYIQIWTNMNAY